LAINIPITKIFANQKWEGGSSAIYIPEVLKETDFGLTAVPGAKICAESIRNGDRSAIRTVWVACSKNTQGIYDVIFEV